MIPFDIIVVTLISPATNVEQKIYSNNKSIGVYYDVCKLEKLVLDLYNEGKSTREIAEEARMSFRD